MPGVTLSGSNWATLDISNLIGIEEIGSWYKTPLLVNAFVVNNSSSPYIVGINRRTDGSYYNKYTLLFNTNIATDAALTLDIILDFSQIKYDYTT